MTAPKHGAVAISLKDITTEQTEEHTACPVISVKVGMALELMS
jgi:hypothetical protein